MFCYCMKFILFFLFIGVMLHRQTQIESFTPIGKYDYLKPFPKSVWGPITIQKFVDTYNTMGVDQLKASTFAMDTKGSLFMKHATEQEAVYYTSYGRWPINEYVTEYLEANPTTIPTGLTVHKVVLTKDNIDNFYPNRYIYMSFISKKESQIKPTPESYQIFKGTAVNLPPEEAQLPTLLASSNVT